MYKRDQKSNVEEKKNSNKIQTSTLSFNYIEYE